jgi:hypothetical protein
VRPDRLDDEATHPESQAGALYKSSALNALAKYVPFTTETAAAGLTSAAAAIPSHAKPLAATAGSFWMVSGTTRLSAAQGPAARASAIATTAAGGTDIAASVLPGRKHTDAAYASSAAWAVSAGGTMFEVGKRLYDGKGSLAGNAVHSVEEDTTGTPPEEA